MRFQSKGSAQALMLGYDLVAINSANFCNGIATALLAEEYIVETVKIFAATSAAVQVRNNQPALQLIRIYYLPLGARRLRHTFYKLVLAKFDCYSEAWGSRSHFILEQQSAVYFHLTLRNLQHVSQRDVFIST